ncbi:N-formylglutamate deformylase [Rhodobacterales bacterium HKCCE2091]|nr:N-formylglutamate deformylase [Rhodobacterales bacterium HKCCE2091]
MSDTVVIRGTGPVILGQPHGATDVPAEIRARLNETGAGLSDTDWHIARLFDGLLASASVVRATTHRYVIDCNRDPAGVSLYPGQNTTGLCPVTDFDGNPIWKDGEDPDAAEIGLRTQAFHAPYHAALREEIERTRAAHGIAILFDCHSIRSTIPFLFEGRLPLLNIGTDEGRTCDARVEAALAGTAAARHPGDWVANGRFKGGWTTRHYGRPETGVHAIQLEIAQRGYMNETPPWDYAEDAATALRETLAEMLGRLDALARSGALAD